MHLPGNAGRNGTGTGGIEGSIGTGDVIHQELSCVKVETLLVLLTHLQRLAEEVVELQLVVAVEGMDLKATVSHRSNNFSILERESKDNKETSAICSGFHFSFLLTNLLGQAELEELVDKLVMSLSVSHLISQDSRLQVKLCNAC